MTGRKRDRIWVVADVIDELEDLDRRIAIRAGGSSAQLTRASALGVVGGVRRM
ncbi:hypothetical protein I8D64_04220 [Brachybacterium sp. MASK1Z-5]|uniref:Uncharacterized protein n=1 Tax=Brachybacterium halotolerans TaxID=2795215 RepID=A0ABS1B7H1_9MICO|nr:hypothetical protein [Brachybacterium halotolerans]MBK0330603.1 hypothetical protein [Brachybacterium halotolerans]